MSTGRAMTAHPVAGRFRTVLRRLASSVAVITSGHGEEAAGMTATAVTSVSLAPPALLVCVNRAASLHPVVAREGRFRVTYLRHDQQDIATAFGGGSAGLEKFQHGRWRLNAPGGPRLAGALAHVVCDLDATFDYGTHTLFIGRVRSVRSRDAEPLVYRDGTYRALAELPGL